MDRKLLQNNLKVDQDIKMCMVLKKTHFSLMHINTHLSIGEETVNDTLQVREGAIRIVPICIR